MKNSAGYQRAIRNQNYGMASDILRLEILNVFGGVYVDVDYWCVKSLNEKLCRISTSHPQSELWNGFRYFEVGNFECVWRSICRCGLLVCKVLE
mmetsp:Transcript_592/g.1040  ORF Transcript_592/g.1040 Transcript_592/m.1040 type:complete len:94 (+) Transcript_592:2-283(+)